MHRTRALFVAFLFLATAAWAVDQPVHRTFNVAPGGTLYLDADVGVVRINSGGSGVTVDVKSHARNQDIANDFHLSFEQAGNDVTVRAKYDRASRWFSWGNDLSVDYIVTVPTNYNVHVATSGGDIKIGDLKGTVYARTSGGDLELGHIGGPVDARTSGGDVQVDQATGAVDVRTSGGGIKIGDAGASVQARTSGGSIDVRRVAGDLYAHTSGGGITVDDALGAIDGETSGGSIRVRFSQQPHADSKLSTSGGGITLAVAGNVAVNLDAHSSGGGVDSDIPITIQGRQDEDSIEGKINGGGPRLVLRSSGGGIHVTKM